MMKKRLEKVTHTFPAFYQKDSRILILGSMPSKRSREEGFYYMHPMNRFWNVLAMVFEENINHEIDEKKLFLKKHQIALWDVLESCDITGSSDASIQNVKVNDIASILAKTNIQKIYTTGRKAYDLYQKYCYETTQIEAILLPSTSPANCACSMEKLVEQYSQIKEV